MEVRSNKETGLSKQNASATTSSGFNRQHCSRKGRTASSLYVIIALCLPVLGLIFPEPGSAETLYCPIKNKMTVQVQYGFEQNLPMKTDEGMLIYLDNDSRFLEKIHLEIIISDALKKYCDGLAVSLYSNLQPLPKDAALPVTAEQTEKKSFLHFCLIQTALLSRYQCRMQGPSNSIGLQAESSKLEASAGARPAQETKQNQPTNLPPGTLGCDSSATTR